MDCLDRNNLGTTLGWDALSDDPDGTSGGLGNRKGYAGYEHDPALAGAWTLYHVRHRVYNADLGRWTRRDPLGYVDGMSLYQYVRSLPYKYVDPDGRFCFDLDCYLDCLTLLLRTTFTPHGLALASYCIWSY